MRNKCLIVIAVCASIFLSSCGMRGKYRFVEIEPQETIDLTRMIFPEGEGIEVAEVRLYRDRYQMDILNKQNPEIGEILTVEIFDFTGQAFNECVMRCNAPEDCYFLNTTNKNFQRRLIDPSNEDTVEYYFATKEHIIGCLSGDISKLDVTWFFVSEQ